VPSAHKAAFVTGVLLAMLVGGSAAPHPAFGTVACADVVRYHETLYAGTFVGRAFHRGARLHATRPGCNDTPGAHEPDLGVTVARVVGVAPALALLATDSARHVYLVSGVFPENPDHPLHIAFYGNRARPNECSGARVLGSVHVRGTVTETPLAFSLLSVRTATHSTRLFWVDAWTRLTFPFTRRLVKGARVDVAAVRCLRPNTTGPVLVARQLRLR
jgi:hypothetical protein